VTDKIAMNIKYGTFWYDAIDTDKNERQGFCISDCGVDKDGETIHEAQMIDFAEEWAFDKQLDYTPPQLKSDDEAIVLAIAEGYEFNDAENPYRVTGKKGC